MNPEKFDFEVLLSTWKKIRDIHPMFKKLYPIAIVDESNLYIYEPSGERYKYLKTVSKPDYIPDNVLAAFPLEAYDWNLISVVHKGALEGDEIVYIFHEFVHCYQFETCGSKLRENLKIYKYYMERGIQDWELTHPFPYEDENISNMYMNMISSAKKRNLKETLDHRIQLRNSLSDFDYEYMVWEEWQEGYARYIENLIRRKLNFNENTIGCSGQMSRITFYCGGEAIIRLLVEDIDRSLYTELERLFHIMYTLKL